MVQIDPYTRAQRHQLASMSLIMLFFLLFTAIQLLNPTLDLADRLITLTPICLLLILIGITVPFNLARLKHLAQLRESVLCGGPALRASEQPAPNPTALPVPSIVELNKSRHFTVLFIVGIFVALCIIFILGAVFSLTNHSTRISNSASPQHSSNGFLLLVLAGGAILGILMILIAIALLSAQARKQMNYSIALNEYGITSTYNGIAASIRWSEARLFAITSQDKPASFRVYELANATTVVQWVNLPPRTRIGWSMAASTEYRNNIQALLSVVAARTSLPLYDFDATLKKQKEAK